MELPKSIIIPYHRNPDIFWVLFLINLHKIIDICLRFDIIQPLTKQTKEEFIYVNPLSNRIPTRRWYY